MYKMPNTGGPVDDAYRILISLFTSNTCLHSANEHFSATITNPIPCQMNESSEIIQTFVTD